ncbi:hypothetical protein [Methanomassiliicoccus luminyensis]|nr:hypothetical protein [Methanomassiliicoccus luminyensis]
MDQFRAGCTSPPFAVHMGVEYRYGEVTGRDLIQELPGTMIVTHAEDDL